jgi:hypothetical protein
MLCLLQTSKVVHIASSNLVNLVVGDLSVQIHVSRTARSAMCQVLRQHMRKSPVHSGKRRLS